MFQTKLARLQHCMVHSVNVVFDLYCLAGSAKRSLWLIVGFDQ